MELKRKIYFFLSSKLGLLVYNNYEIYSELKVYE